MRLLWLVSLAQLICAAVAVYGVYSGVMSGGTAWEGRASRTLRGLTDERDDCGECGPKWELSPQIVFTIMFVFPTIFVAIVGSFYTWVFCCRHTGGGGRGADAA